MSTDSPEMSRGRWRKRSKNKQIHCRIRESGCQSSYHRVSRWGRKAWCCAKPPQWHSWGKRGGISDLDMQPWTTNTYSQGDRALRLNTLALELDWCGFGSQVNHFFSSLSLETGGILILGCALKPKENVCLKCWCQCPPTPTDLVLKWAGLEIQICFRNFPLSRWLSFLISFSLDYSAPGPLGSLSSNTTAVLLPQDLCTYHPPELPFPR